MLNFIQLLVKKALSIDLSIGDLHGVNCWSQHRVNHDIQRQLRGWWKTDDDSKPLTTLKKLFAEETENYMHTLHAWNIGWDGRTNPSSNANNAWDCSNFSILRDFIRNVKTIMNECEKIKKSKNITFRDYFLLFFKLSEFWQHSARSLTFKNSLFIF